jgi:hypothetical protein
MTEQQGCTKWPPRDAARHVAHVLLDVVWDSYLAFGLADGDRDESCALRALDKVRDEMLVYMSNTTLALSEAVRGGLIPAEQQKEHWCVNCGVCRDCKMETTPQG